MIRFHSMEFVYYINVFLTLVQKVMLQVRITKPSRDENKSGIERLYRLPAILFIFLMVLGPFYVQ